MWAIIVKQIFDSWICLFVEVNSWDPQTWRNRKSTVFPTCAITDPASVISCFCLPRFLIRFCFSSRGKPMKKIKKTTPRRLRLRLMAPPMPRSPMGTRTEMLLAPMEPQGWVEILLEYSSSDSVLPWFFMLVGFSSGNQDQDSGGRSEGSCCRSLFLNIWPRLVVPTHSWSRNSWLAGKISLSFWTDHAKFCPCVQMILNR